MSPFVALTILIIYFSVLIAISIYTSKGADTNTFFTANKQSPWYLVAFAMIGTSLSGVTFISVPGAVGNIQFSYFQVILGNVVGYIFVATVLMPLYYRLNLVSIYSYLEQRFGFWAYKTGSAFFLIARTLGSAVRLYIAAQVLQIALYNGLGIPFEVSVLITIGLIWIYTFKGGVKTIIITDTLQTTFLVAAVMLTIYLISAELNFSFGDLVSSVANDPKSRIFFFDDLKDDKYFWKKFISGVFIAITMTGMDQDLMQKNLTCKNIGEAQKNMFSFTATFVVVNLMFLSLGVLLYQYAQKEGIALPTRTDELYPMLALQHFGVNEGTAGLLVAITFLIGITAATYASSDSALTALTTSFCIDFMNVATKTETERARIKHWVHIGFSLLFYVVILLFNQLNSKEVVTAVFDIAGYTYGPLLGLFAFGLYTSRQVRDRFVPFVCVLGPLLTYVLNQNSQEWFGGYKIGFERLILNGFLIFLGLWAISEKKK
ncbi:MAG: sodium:solute symporter [Runella slithyformis]|nr:MAG: sodium:solute symporter [Runella slithyformis]TAF96458.1 MAG: sodium:solute symporter [Runella sp.]TAG18438.1 MAG: sodium:solute symporter [Cytophagales bacterium]TAG39733.1 MAG: sodium:solute symporter [Cytophagia bacterium]TAF27181.1 MAG: sodium:solute symporter [Runella slithyformis]